MLWKEATMVQGAVHAAFFLAHGVIPRRGKLEESPVKRARERTHEACLYRAKYRKKRVPVDRRDSNFQFENLFLLR